MYFPVRDEPSWPYEHDDDLLMWLVLRLAVSAALATVLAWGVLVGMLWDALTPDAPNASTTAPSVPATARHETLLGSAAAIIPAVRQTAAIAAARSRRSTRRGTSQRLRLV